MERSGRKSDVVSQGRRSCAIVAYFIFIYIYVSHCSGRDFRPKLMSRYIGAGQNDRFDVRIQELVSKVQDPGGIFEKKHFIGSIFGSVI